MTHYSVIIAHEKKQQQYEGNYKMLKTTALPKFKKLFEFEHCLKIQYFLRLDKRKEFY